MTGMGTCHTSCRIENTVDRTRAARIPKLLVDTGSEYTWVPEKMLEHIGIDREKKDVAFVIANGQQVTRSIGFAIIRVAGYFTIDEVVFAERGDLLLLGARTLEGMNLTVGRRPRSPLTTGPPPAVAAEAVRCNEAAGRITRRTPHAGSFPASFASHAGRTNDGDTSRRACRPGRTRHDARPPDPCGVAISACR
ncbi:MAG: aspartyl protease family protein [Planctomycetes bacterium]|nr:aspartyl protease family protein [Planctomycetota bacterium]